MSDLIDKDLAIAAIRKKLKGLPITVMTLPAEQPEKRTNERTETHARDCISRHAAIDATQGIGRLATLPDNDAVIRMSAVEYVLFNLPSVQPYTDAEIQKMQELEQAELQAAYEQGKQDAQPEIIRCRDCVNHVDRNFCRKANHYTGDGEYCASVFGAERRKSGERKRKRDTSRNCSRKQNKGE